MKLEDKDIKRMIYVSSGEMELVKKGSVFTRFALSIINYSQIIHNFDRIARTGLFAFSAADAGVFAGFAGICTLLTVAADHSGSGFLRYHVNNLLRTGLTAQSAAETAGCIHVGNAVCEINGF